MSDREFVDRLFWKEENPRGPILLDSILLMLFKPGVCVAPQENLEIDVKRLQRDVVWKSGVLTSSYAVPNEHENGYNEARIAFL